LHRILLFKISIPIANKFC